MPTSRAGTSSNSGFTLLELIVALFVISLVMAVVLPSFTFFGEGKLKSEAREMASLLRYLHDSAVSRKETFPLKFDLSANTLSWQDPDGNKTKRFHGMTGVETQSTGMISRGELIIFFEPSGVRENIIVTMNRDNHTMTVTLNHLSGRVKVKDESAGEKDAG